MRAGQNLGRQKREHEAQMISKDAQTSASKVRAAASSRSTAEVRATASSVSTASTIQYFLIGPHPDTEMIERIDESEERYKTEGDYLQRNLAPKRPNIKQEASRHLDGNPGAMSTIFESDPLRAEHSRSGHAKKLNQI